MPDRARLAALVAAVSLFGACAMPPAPQKTQLEVREVQTRTFDTTDSKMVMKAMLNVLQDDGFVVKNAVVELGLITATKESDLAPGHSSESAALFGMLGGGSLIFGGGGNVAVGAPSETSFRKTEVLDFTGNVSDLGGQTKVRVTFQRKILDNRGEVVAVSPIEDGDFYQTFFSRMDKGLFLQSEQL